VFKDGQELLSMTTKYVNAHDELIARLDASGQALAEHVYERRLECFNNFIGPLGRGKNMPLFYCFLVWEGNGTRWTTRRLPNNVGVSSVGSALPSPSSNTITGSSVIGGSKRSRETAQILSQVLSAASPNNLEVSAAVQQKKCAYIDAKTATEVQTARNLRTENLQRMMESSAFANLTQANQDKITQQWLDSSINY
jgi:hypothetical protein